MTQDHSLEEWRSLDFIGFPNYAISSFGRVRHIRFDRILSQYPNQKGLYHVGLHRKGIRTNKSVAPLVAQAFLPEPRNPRFNAVCHRDGNRSNNSYENLEWRPLWFVIRYQREYHNYISYPRTPVIETTTGLKFKTGRDAANYFCLFEREVHRACETGESPTFGSKYNFEYEKPE